MNKKNLTNKLRSKLKAVTLIEVIITLAIVALVFSSLIGVIILFYKANVLVNTYVQLDSEAVYVRGYLDSVLKNALADSIDCTFQSIDLNQDGINDDVLIRFKTILRENKLFIIGVLNQLENPTYTKRVYRKLILAELDEDTGAYSVRSALTSPLINITQTNIQCSDVVELPGQEYKVRTITFDIQFETTVQEKDVFPGGSSSPLVREIWLTIPILVTN